MLERHESAYFSQAQSIGIPACKAHNMDNCSHTRRIWNTESRNAHVHLRPHPPPRLHACHDTSGRLGARKPLLRLPRNRPCAVCANRSWIDGMHRLSRRRGLAKTPSRSRSGELRRLPRRDSRQACCQCAWPTRRTPLDWHGAPFVLKLSR